jgi:hypothetical protein
MATLEEYARLSALVYGSDIAAGATDIGWQVAETPAHAPIQLSAPSVATAPCS